MYNLVDRTEKNWDFATDNTFYWKDTIGSWVFPSASNTEGWYYPGIIISLIIFFGIFAFFFKQIKINSFDKKIFIFSIIFILFITYFSWGKYSYLFSWSWENLPIIGSLRAWARINIIIVPILILLFSISLKYLVFFFSENRKQNLKQIIKLLVGISIFFMAVQFLFYFFDLQNEEYWNFWQKKRFDAAINYLPFFLGNILKLYDGVIYILFNILSITFLIFFLKIKNIQKKLILFYTTIFLLVVSELFVISNLQWSLPEWKTKFYKTENPLEKLQDGFKSKRIIDTVKGNEYFRDNRLFNVNYPDNYGYSDHAKNFSTYFQRYDGLKNTGISDENINLVKFFYGATEEAKKIFLSKSLDHENIVSFINDSNSFEKGNSFEIKILINQYDGNKLELEILSEKEGWLSFIDNWDYGWIASVNGTKVPIYKLLGSYKSIKIKKGFSKVKFQYKPW